MGDPNFGKGIPFEFISQAQIERHRRIAGMEHHLAKASFPRLIFAELDELSAQALALPIRVDGNLPHLDLVLAVRGQNQTPQDFPVIPEGAVEIARLCGKLLGAELKPERPAQDLVPQRNRRLVLC